MTDLSQRISSLAPGQLQRFLHKLGERSPQAAEPPIRPRARDGAAVPASFAQERVWFLDQLEPGTPVYNMAAALHLHGQLRIDVLAAALNGVVRRHEALRTVFASVTGRPIQIVLEHQTLPLPLIDLTSLPALLRESEGDRLALLSTRISFSLERGPLLSAWLLLSGEDRHVLLLTIHHIIFDGWSMAVFTREVATFYEAFSSGRPSPLPELEIQYPDFAGWQREWLRGEALDRLASYWRGHLDGLPVLQLPTDRPRPAVQSHRGANHRLEIPPETTGRLRALARAEDATLFTVLLAGFKALLSRYSGQNDLGVGTFMANRNRTQTEGVIGFFVNNLALRTRSAPDLSFRQLVARVGETTANAHTHQDLPFEVLLETLQPERSLSHTPIYQVMLVLQNTPKTTLRLPGLEISRVNLGADRSNFDLTLWMEEAEGLAVRLEYATDLFGAASAGRLASHFVHLLDSALADPSRRIGELTLLGESERRQLLGEWSRSDRSYPTGGLVHDLFAAQAAARPEAVALVGDGWTLRYGELEIRAERLARRLRALGVGPEVPVGICVDPPEEVVTGLLGILKAGGAYLPLDPSYPSERLRFMLEDAAAPVLLTQSKLEDRIPSSAARRLLLDGLEDTEWSGEAPVRPMLPGHLAYVIYTSGSTGRPKGVAVSHAQLLPMLLWSRDLFGLGSHTRVLQNLPYSFDFGLFELLTTLISGGSLHFTGERIDFTRAAAAVGERGLDTIHTTPAYIREILAAGYDLRSLNVVHLGGEALTWELVDRIFAATGEHCRVFNGYGPTEATINSSIEEAHRGQDRLFGQASGVLIGRATANNAIYLLDRQGELAPVGVPAELCVGGDGLARGYLNRPDLTAERFVPNRFGEAQGSRLYRTGDLARRQPDGRLEFLGRNDEQVKVRGFRIELGEIEALLADHPGIRDAVVLAREDHPGVRRLVAYLVPSLHTLTTTELRDFLKGRLPEHMVPSTFVTLTALPLSPNGKVDRAALPPPDSSRPELERRLVAPRNLTEEILAGIWAEVLGLRDIGIYDDFFELGGFSLLATQAIARVRAAFAIELPLATFFEAPTIAEQALRIDQAGPWVVPSITRVPRDGHLPLSFAQERIWFLTQLAPEDTSYHVPRALRLSGSLDLVIMERAYSALIQRHEILRTTFPTVEGRPVQRIHPPEPFNLLLVDLQTLDMAMQKAETERWIRDLGKRLFDLERGPLLRAAVLRLAPREHVAVQVEHHLVHDGWTEGVLLRDFLGFYSSFVEGRAPELPELPIQFADFAAWQRQWLQGEVLATQLSYWQKQLTGVPALLDLPTDHPRPARRTGRGKETTLRFSGQLIRPLRALARRSGATLFMTMLAAFAAVLHRYSGQNDIVVGTFIANRRLHETEGLLGMILNTLPLRIQLEPQGIFRDVLTRAREVCLGAYAHQDLPFEKIVEAVQPERSLSYTPLFQSTFAFHDAPHPIGTVSGLSVELVSAHNRSAKFDLLLIAVPHGDDVLLLWENSTDLFEAATMERMRGHLTRALEEVGTDGEVRVSALRLMSSPEEHQLLVEWGDTAASSATAVCIHRAVEAQAARQPAATAVVFDGEELSYGALDARADRLAGRLRSLGVEPEAVVGLCIERSPDLLIALLAVLKAGGAYLPLDPSYPRERLSLILEDARARVLVTRPDFAEVLSGTSAEMVLLGSATGLAAERLDDALGPDPEPESLAYVIYTSGSTGRPKGVQVPHGALTNFLESMLRQPGLHAGDILLAVTSFSFDIAALELLLPLRAGGRLVLASQAESADGERLLDLLSRSGATVMQATPATWRLLLDAGWKGSPALKILCGGEALPGDLAARLHERGREIWNLYGPTETTIWSAVCLLPPNARTVSLGGPIANTRLYVASSDLRPVPIGVPGELLIGGDGVTRGYLGQPALTAERYWPDPFAGRKGARLYRTGDLARYWPNGRLEFLGRFDHQVKVRGFRIELGEIETALMRHPGIAEAIVVAQEGMQTGDRRLVAYVVAATESRPAVDELRQALLQTLPEYMIPSSWLYLDALPLTPNRKVDRRALPKREHASLGGFVAPRNSIEALLAETWSAVLKVDRIGVHDNFFELGGHSLLANQVAARLRQALSVQVPLRRFFETPTVAELAAGLGAALAGGAGPDLPLRRQPRRWAPLSFAQERLWFLHQLEPEGNAYHIAEAIRLTGPLNGAAFARALREVVDRHEALRTAFSAGDAAPVQIIAESVEIPWLQVDLIDLPAVRRESAAADLASQLAHLPFDLASPPLLRTMLLRLDLADHVLVLVMHHIVSDGWSMRVLLQETTALYTALERGAPASLPELPIQYADFAAWQRQWLQGERLDSLLLSWQRQLAGAPTLLDLPADRPWPAVQRSLGGRERLAIRPLDAQALRAVARRHGVSLFMVLLAALGELLRRSTHQEDLLIGSPTANRARPEVEHLIGVFINTLVLRLDLASDPAMADLLARIRETVLRADAGQDLPFEKLVDALKVTRDLSRPPVFQVMLALQNLPAADHHLPGLALRSFTFPRHAAQFELLFSLAETPGGLEGFLDYRIDLFDSTTARRLAQHFETLLLGLAADSEGRLSRMPMLGASERQQVLVEWNDTVADYPRQICLHQLIEAQVRRNPSALAVTFEGRHLTYAELEARAGCLAAHLRAQGCGPESRVGVVMERSRELVVALLGVLKAGAAYVPIDPEYPQERIAFMLEDARPAVLLVQERLLSRLPDIAVPAFCLDEGWTGSDAVTENPAETPDDHHLAYVIYTSGSTGRPKGAMVPHRGICNRLLWMQDAYRLSAADRVLQKTPFSFDVSVWEFFWPLLAGATIVVARPGGHRDATYLVELIAQERVSVVHFVPPMLQVFLEQNDLSSCQSLRLVVCSGEALPAELAGRCRERLGTVLENLYGPTEASVDVTSWTCEPGGGRSIPIGRPIANTQIYLLDHSLRPLPLGVAGELSIGGVNIGRGYLGQPALTAERFVPDPFGKPGSRLYRTGDLARHLTSGAIEFLGRIDHQVKVHGFRIELGEIEAALARHPNVREAVAVVREGGRLVAYAVPRTGAALSPAELRSFLGAWLPDFMIPAQIAILAALPLSPNGKVDRRALPAPDATLDSARYVAPRNAVEEELAGIWARLLQVERVGVEDNFFDLGGDSIEAVRLASRVNEEMSTSLRVQDIFRHPSIAALSPQIAAARSGVSIAEEMASGRAKIERLCATLLADERQRSKVPADAEDLYPLSGIEKGMVYYSLLMPEEPVYIDQYVYLVHLEDPDRFFQAFDLLIDRHSNFRSSFHLYSFDEPMKAVHRQLRIARECEDLSRLPTGLQRERVEEYQRADLAQRFRFDGEFLWRCKLFRLDDSLHALVWTCYHALLDGWSNHAFWTEMNELCGRGDLHSLALPRLASDYKDYVAISLGRQSSPATERFWHEMLDGYGRNKLPFNRSARRESATGMQRLTRRPRRELLDALRSRARKHHVSLQAVCLAAQIFLLHLTTGEDDVVTGVVSHERPEIKDGDQIIGCFLNTVPIRSDRTRVATGLALILKVNEYLREKRQHEILLSDIAAMSGLRESADNPFFDTLFNFMDFHVVEEATQNVLFTPMSSAVLRRELAFMPEEMTNTLFDLEVSTTLGEFTFWIKYSPKHFERPDVEKALDLYARILESWVQDIESPLSAEALLSRAEWEQTVLHFNDTQHPYPREKALYRLFEEQVRHRPEGTAVVCAGRSLTYLDLDQHANRLARHLLECGVRPAENVAVLFERSIDLVVALLATLKVGAAYVPIEPAYPALRKSYILRQSKVVWVLADHAYDLGLPGATATLLIPDPQVLATYADADLEIDARPDDLAYTIYTSGSTGDPKGVMIEHHAAVNLIHWVNRTFSVGPAGRLLLLSSVCFDLSVYDIFGALSSGASVVVATPDDLRDPARLMLLVETEKITFWSSVPSTMGMLVRYLEEAAPDFRQRDLEVVFLSGDWIPLTLPPKIKRFFPNARVISLGGATEATVWSNVYTIQEIEPWWASIPYGRPIANTSFYILDRNLDVVPAGVVGWLYIGGVGVARGYANDPERTAQAFLPDRFLGSGRERMYRTGDLGRMLPSGDIEFLGRADHQVKIRGFRIELGEIESQLGRHERVETAVAMDRVDGSGERFLCAYVVPRGQVTAAELKEHLAASLPDYMIPTTFVSLPELPLTPNGKVDRRALPQPGLDGPGNRVEYVAPANEVESAIVEVWQEVLGLDEIGTRHDFFALGGHSLSAVQLVTRLRRRFNVEIPLRSLFEAPTVAELAAQVAAARQRHGAAASQAIERVPRGTGLPLSYAQQRIWFLQKLEPGSPAFGIGSALRLSGRIDLAAFQSSLDGVCERHETLRTTFVETAGEPQQIIASSRPLQIPVVDLSRLPMPLREQETHRVAEEEAGRTFDLEHGPLLRLVLLRLSPDEHAALFNMHHIVSDGWSLGVFQRDLVAFYDAYSQGRLPTLSELPVHYVDYVQWQRLRLHSKDLEEQLSFWRRQLSGELPAFVLPGQKKRPSAPRFRGASLHWELPPDLVEALRALGHQQGATLFMTLLAGLTALIHLHSGQEDLIIGTSVAGRDREEIEGLIGFFINNLTLRMDLSGKPSFRKLLERVREVAINAFAHQEIPFEKLIEELQPQRYGSYTPLIQVALVLQNFPMPPSHLAELAIAPVELPNQTSSFDLTLMLTENGDGVAGSFIYDIDLFDSSAIARMGAQLHTLLKKVAAEPDQALASIALLGAAEAQRKVDEFNEDF